MSRAVKARGSEGCMVEMMMGFEIVKRKEGKGREENESDGFISMRNIKTVLGRRLVL